MTRANPIVLVVDDDSEIRRGVVDVLRRAGCEVVEAADGNEALTVAVNTKPALVFLDMSMPGGPDGAEVAEELRRRPGGENTALVALSAQVGQADREKALRAGCNLYLTKPCSPQRIREVAWDLLRLGAPPGAGGG